MKVIVAGSRNYSDISSILTYLDKFSIHYNIEEIVSGLARGPDTYGKIWAESKGIPVAKFPADWNKFGKAAGYIRNKQMAEYGDHLIAFWDGYSKGTDNMIKEAAKLNLSIDIVKENSLEEW